MKLELMDWKKIEEETTDQLRTAVANEIIAKTLLKKCHEQIKALGGKTLEEEDAEAKAKREEGEPILTK